MKPKELKQTNKLNFLWIRCLKIKNNKNFFTKKSDIGHLKLLLYVFRVTKKNFAKNISKYEAIKFCIEF